MIGGIDAENAASIRFHERLGFERVAHFKEVGHTFGRWLDLVFVQRFLDEPGAARPSTPDPQGRDTSGSCIVSNKASHEGAPRPKAGRRDLSKETCSPHPQ
jgi:hypothetical protein